MYIIPLILWIFTYCQQELSTLWDECRRFHKPHRMPVDLSEKLYNLRHSMIHKLSHKVRNLIKNFIYKLYPLKTKGKFIPWFYYYGNAKYSSRVICSSYIKVATSFPT